MEEERSVDVVEGIDQASICGLHAQERKER